MSVFGYFNPYDFEKVSAADIYGKPAVVNRGNIGTDVNCQNYSVMLVQPQPSTTLLNGANNYKFLFDPSQYDVVTRFTIRFDIAESGGSSDMQLAPVPSWFSFIDVKSGAGSGAVIQRLLPEQLYWESCCLIPESRKTADDLEGASMDVKSYGKGPLHPRGSTRSYRLRLLNLPIVRGKMLAKNLNQPLSFELQLNGPIVASGSGTPSLTNIYMEVTHDRLNSSQLGIFSGLKSKRQVIRFLRAERISSGSGQTITAGSNYNLLLDPAGAGISPFMVVGIRAQNPVASADGLVNYIDIGDINASIDLQTPSGLSLLTNGGIPVAVDRHQMNYANLGVANFAKYRKMYLLQFCKDIPGAFEGKMTGSLALTGAKNQLVIKPDAAPTSAVFSISSSSTIAGLACGYIRLKYKNSTSAPLAYNTSTANLAVAFNALPDALRDQVTASFNQDFTSTSNSCVISVTLTCKTELPQSSADDYLQVINESGATSATGNVSTLVGYTTTLSTPGVRGFSTMSGTAQVDALVYFFWQYVEEFGVVSEVKKITG